MERKRLRVGLEVGVLPANLARTRWRRATITAIEDKPNPRLSRAWVRYLDSGTEVAVRFARLVFALRPPS